MLLVLALLAPTFGDAAALEARGEHRAAVEAWRRAALAHPNDPGAAEALYDSARVAWDLLMEPALAEPAVAELLARYPDSAAAARSLARRAWFAARDPAAVRASRADPRGALVAHPDHPDSWMNAIVASQAMPLTAAHRLLDAHAAHPTHGWLVIQERVRREAEDGAMIRAWWWAEAADDPVWVRRTRWRVFKRAAVLLAGLAMIGGWLLWRRRRA